MIVLTDLEEVTVPFGEGPPTISIRIAANPAGLSLEDWVRTEDMVSNFSYSLDGALTPVDVGGEEGLAYRYTGLYENDAVAVAHEGKIYLFDAGWIAEDDVIRDDFEFILQTVSFD